MRVLQAATPYCVSGATLRKVRISYPGYRGTSQAIARSCLDQCFCFEQALQSATLKQVRWGKAVRDIRNDLQERADFFEEQIRAACAHFERRFQQLQGERDARLADLNSGLAMLEKLIAFEDTLMSNVVTLENPSTPPLSLAERIRAARD